MQAGHIRQSFLPGAVHSQAEQDEAQLVKASQQRDQNAFALLVRRHQRCIFNLSLGLLQDEEGASESAHEAFVTAWQGLPGFRGGEVGFPTWLYRIAYRCCLRQLKRRKREHARHSAIQAEQVLVERSTEKQAVEALEKRDLQALIREQLEHLPLKYRAVLILRHLHDKTYEEIAAILSIPGGTVKTHLFRARILLKARLLAQPLVTRETVLVTPLVENENVMHISEPFHFHEGGQNSSAVNQETEGFSQQQHTWLEQQQGWIEQRRTWLVERRGWIEQRRGWVTQQDEKLTQQQEAWLAQQEAWLGQQYTSLVQQVSEMVQQSQWMSQRRSWLDRQQRQFTQQDYVSTQGDEAEEPLSG